MPISGCVGATQAWDTGGVEGQKEREFHSIAVISIIWASSTMMFHFLCQLPNNFHIYYSQLLFKTSHDMDIVVPIL